MLCRTRVVWYAIQHCRSCHMPTCDNSSARESWKDAIPPQRHVTLTLGTSILHVSPRAASRDCRLSYVVVHAGLQWKQVGFFKLAVLADDSSLSWGRANGCRQLSS